MKTFTLNGAPMDYGDFWTGQGDRAIFHKANCLDLWSDDELAAIGIVRTVVDDPPPPPAPRPELPKSTVVSRLNTIGKLAAVFTVIQSSPLLFGLWFAPDWPNVYCDDADVLSAFSAAGLTADEVSQVMAPPV